MSFARNRDNRCGHVRACGKGCVLRSRVWCLTLYLPVKQNRCHGEAPGHQLCPGVPCLFRHACHARVRLPVGMGALRVDEKLRQRRRKSVAQALRGKKEGRQTWSAETVPCLRRAAPPPGKMLVAWWAAAAEVNRARGNVTINIMKKKREGGVVMGYNAREASLAMSPLSRGVHAVPAARRQMTTP